MVLTHFVNGQFGNLQDPASVFYIESVFSSLCVLLNRVFINIIISAYKLRSVMVSHWALFFNKEAWTILSLPISTSLLVFESGRKGKLDKVEIKNKGKHKSQNPCIGIFSSSR